MAIETIAAVAAKKVIADAAPVVITAIGATITKGIISNADDIAKTAVGIGGEIALAPLNVACSILEGINSLFD